MESVNLFVDSNLTVRRHIFSTNSHNYHLLKQSIDYALAWLRENVLYNPNNGYHIRKRLESANNIYTLDMARYLYNSCRYWAEELKTRDAHEMCIRGGAPLPDQIKGVRGKYDRSRRWSTPPYHRPKSSHTYTHTDVDLSNVYVVSESDRSYISQGVVVSPSLIKKMETKYGGHPLVRVTTNRGPTTLSLCEVLTTLGIAM